MSGTVKVILLGAVIVLLLVLGFFIITNGPDEPQAPSNNGTKIEDTTTSPDQVKEQGAPSGDTTPSPSGTGPGSDNSLLSE